MKSILFFDKIRIEDIALVGGKNASLGEMFTQLHPKGIEVPNGFAVTADAFRAYCQHNQIDQTLQQLIKTVHTDTYDNLSKVGQQCRQLVLNGAFPEALQAEVKAAYQQLSSLSNTEAVSVAVRSSATAEDLPTASFAGRMESYLNISGEQAVMEALRLCYASLYTDRAIKYRFDMGFVDLDIAISVGVQQMVRSDLGASGVAFTIDPDSGFRPVVVINGIWGLGENIVQGRVTPDEWMVFKPTMERYREHAILKKRLGAKEFTMVYSPNPTLNAQQTTLNLDTTPEKSAQYCLEHSEVLQLAEWCVQIEQHYQKTMDIEWAKDGITGKLYIVQARPETIHGKSAKKVRAIYELAEKGKVLAQGIALGEKIASGKARILKSPEEGDLLQDGEIVVTDITNPDWDMVLKRAAGIITNKGGRTSHAAIVARELGTVAIVGTHRATETIPDGAEITISCAEGKEGYVYEGILPWSLREEDFSELPLPQRTAPMLILADPDRAFELSQYPNKGVGLLRLEFTITNSLQVHPLALCQPEKVTDPSIQKQIAERTKGFTDGKHYFVDTLAEAVGMVAAAFYPNEVIVRMSDFKSNEYANLLGGHYFEPHEENPMIGLRGASRYYSEFYREGFALECAAMKKVRDERGFRNVKLMIPFCRTLEEGQKVLEELERNGLKRGENGLQVYMMVEIPSNVLLADAFAELFDGFSIGSNDLTQLTLGLDRDSALVSYLFNEENPAVKALIAQTVEAAKRHHIRVGLCGQAPSDLPEFASFLVGLGIDSISFNPDALIRGVKNILAAEG
jgi:pyruvate,water dikinase